MDYLEKNLAAIKTVDPRLAEWIETEPDTDWVNPIDSGEGVLNFSFKSQFGDKLAHNLQDPLSGTLGKEKDRIPAGNGTTVIIGIGLGYIVESVLERMEAGHVVLVAEHTAQLVRLALRRCDFSRAVSSGALILACGERQRIIDKVAKLNVVKFTQKAAISIITEGYAELLEDRYGSLKKKVLGRIHTIRGLVGSNSLYGFQADLNEVRSCPRFLLSQGVGELAGRFKGFPGILVSTGPSLGRNIRLLKNARGSALIIAVGQALRPLLAYGIRPDLISFIDYLDHAIDHLTGLMTLRDVPLLSVPKACRPLIEQWQGPLLVAGTEDENVLGCLPDLWKKKGELASGVSVAHFNLALAQYLGLDPIILVGQDFAVDEKFTHFDQVDHRHKITSSENNRVVTRMDDDKAVNKGLELNRGKMYTLPGYFGGEVGTFNNLLAQRDQFQGMIGKGEERVINCTEGGAEIENTIQMRLSQALETYCRKPIPRELLNSLGEKDKNGQGLIREYLPLLKSELAGLKRIRNQAAAAMKVNKRLSAALNKSAPNPKKARKITSLANRNRKYAQEILRVLEKTPFLRAVLFWARHEIEAEMKKRRDRGEEERQIRLASDYRLAEEALSKSAILAKAYEEAVQILEQYLEDAEALARSPKDPEALADLAETLLEMGERGESLALTAEARGRAPKDPDFVFEYGRLCLEADRYGRVREVLEALAGLPGAGELEKELREDYRLRLNNILSGAEDDLAAGFYARALVDLEKFPQDEPESARVREMITLCQRELARKAAEAEQEADSAWEKFEKRDLRQEYDRILSQVRGLDQDRKRSPEALDLFNSAIELDPERPEARWGLATTLCLLEKFEEAEPVYEKLVRDDPRNPHLRLELGWLKVRLGRTAEGIESITPLEEGIGDHPELLPALADFYTQAQKFETALRYYEHHLKINKKDFTVWTKRGDCLLHLGQQKKAAGSYRTALALNPEYFPAARGLEKSEVENQEVPKAGSLRFRSA